MRRFALPAALFTFFLLPACDPSPMTVRSCTSSADCMGGQVCLDGTCRHPIDGGPNATDGGPGNDAHFRNLTGIHVMPPSSTLVAVDGMMPTVDFDVIADYDDGTSAALASGVWTADAPVLGSVDRTTGVYTAGGVIAGSATITVSASGMMATAMVTVQIQRNVIDTGAPADAATHFASSVPTVADPARAAHVLYPLTGAVLPQNVYPADTQWSGGTDGDLYQVRLDGPGVQVRAYVVHSGASFGYHWLATTDAWRALAESATEQPITIAVDRWESSSNTVITDPAVTIRFANATIRGAIYYWDLGAGRIQRSTAMAPAA